MDREERLRERDRARRAAETKVCELVILQRKKVFIQMTQ